MYFVCYYDESTRVLNHVIALCLAIHISKKTSLIASFERIQSNLHGQNHYLSQ